MNRIHRLLCRSGYWRNKLSQKIMPWAMRGAELGENVLEVGPGPGLTTEILRQRFAQVTAIEIDLRLAQSLQQRMRGTNVRVIEGDATAMPFPDGSFSGAVSFTMLHHVPSPALQDQLLAEVHRALKPGGIFIGTDSVWSRIFQLLHFRDTMVLVDPNTFAARLEKAGFTDVSVKVADRAFKFRARRP